jgi:hypothetical protein
MAWATSAGVPTRCIGMLCKSLASRSEPTGLRFRYISVSVGPGATAFTVMPLVASSFAQIRVQVSSAALAAAYGVRSGVPRVVKVVTLTMRDLHSGAHVHVVGLEQVVEVDGADQAEAGKTDVVDHRIDGAGTDDLRQSCCGRVPIGEVHLVKLSRKVGRC